MLEVLDYREILYFTSFQALDPTSLSARDLWITWALPQSSDQNLSEIWPEVAANGSIKNQTAESELGIPVNSHAN
jgi:hypothetical protein